MQNNLLGWWNVSVCGQSNAAIFFLDWISLYILSGKHENPVVTHLTVACPLYTHCSYKQKGNEMVYTNTTVCPVDIVCCVPPMLLHDSVQVPNLESVSSTIENNCIRCNCTPPPPPFPLQLTVLISSFDHSSLWELLSISPVQPAKKGGHWHFLYLSLDLYFRTMLWVSLLK